MIKRKRKKAIYVRITDDEQTKIELLAMENEITVSEFIRGLIRQEEVKKGDSVVTVGGIHGKIAQIEGDIIFLDVEKGGKLKIDKSSISLDSSKKAKDRR